MRAIERWTSALQVAQNNSNPPIPPVGDSHVFIGITVGSTPSLWNGPAIPPEYPQGDFVQVVATTGIDFSTDGNTWTTYPPGEPIPVSGDIRKAIFFVKNGSLSMQIRFSAPPSPQVPWYQSPDIPNYTWDMGTPAWWKEADNGNTRSLWAALFEPLNLAQYVASRAVLLVDPNKAPDISVLEEMVSATEGEKIRPLLPENIYRGLLSRIFLALKVRGTPLLGGALTPLIGGTTIYWHQSIPNRRFVVYSGGAPLNAVKTILRRLLPAHVEIEMQAYLGFPCHADYVWEGMCWTFSERTETFVF